MSSADEATQFVYDHGLLAVTDASTSSASASSSSAVINSSTLQAGTHKSIASLLQSIISQLPIKVDADHGPIVTLPIATTPLPRAKSLPKAKPLTKWEQFAKKKGIAPKKKEGKMVYDEDLQEWVPKWGYGGINKKEQEQWIHEVPAGKDDDYDPAKEAKKEYKKRRLVNEGQRQRNIQRAQNEAASKDSLKAKANDGLSLSQAEKAHQRSQRKAQLEAETLRTRTSTASMGRFDKRLEGEQEKAKGIRRQFESNERDARDEKKRSLAILGKLNGNSSSSSKNADVVNSRKAIRFESKGSGALSLARQNEGKKRKARN
ncbi:unnamed protein product [Sympodiomycopsis kandeliae]